MQEFYSWIIFLFRNVTAEDNTCFLCVYFKTTCTQIYLTYYCLLQLCVSLKPKGRNAIISCFVVLTTTSLFDHASSPNIVSSVFHDLINKTTSAKRFASLKVFCMTTLARLLHYQSHKISSYFMLHC